MAACICCLAKGKGRPNSLVQHEPCEGRGFDGSGLWFTWFYSSPFQKRKLPLPALGICNKHCAPSYTSASASRNPTCDSCTTCRSTMWKLSAFGTPHPSFLLGILSPRFRNFYAAVFVYLQTGLRNIRSTTVQVAELDHSLTLKVHLCGWPSGEHSSNLQDASSHKLSQLNPTQPNIVDVHMVHHILLLTVKGYFTLTLTSFDFIL